MSDIERVARAIAVSYGNDPDEHAPLTVCCTADNKPVAWWFVYEEQARAALSALLPLSPEVERKVAYAGCDENICRCAEGHKDRVERCLTRARRTVQALIEAVGGKNGD